MLKEKNKKNISSQKVVVLFRLSAMGDVALLTGVMRYWHENFGMYFIVITREAFAPLFCGHPALHSVETLRQEDLTSKAYRTKCKFLAQKYVGYDLFDLHASTRSRILSFFWKGRVIRYKKFPLHRRIFLLSHGLWGGKKLCEQNVCQRYASVWQEYIDKALKVSSDKFSYASEENNASLEMRDTYAHKRDIEEQNSKFIANIPKEKLVPKIYLLEEEREKACQRLVEVFAQENISHSIYSNDNKKILHTRKVIAMHPFATHASKSLSMEAWQALAVKIQAEFFESHEILWVGIGNMPEKTSGKSLVNQTSLRELCALLSCCDLLITGDSGPMHLANAVNCKLLALFGPTCEEWGFFPVAKDGAENKENYVVEQENIPNIAEHFFCGEDNFEPAQENHVYEENNILCSNVRILQKQVPCRPCSLHGAKACKNNYQCFSFTDSDILSIIQELIG